MKRLENESFENYKLRRKECNNMEKMIKGLGVRVYAGKEPMINTNKRISKKRRRILRRKENKN